MLPPGVDKGLTISQQGLEKGSSQLEVRSIEVKCSVWNRPEIKPHLGGHWVNTQPVVTDQFELSNTLTSTQCCPLAVSLGLRRWFCGVSQALMSPARRRRNGQGAALSAG